MKPNILQTLLGGRKKREAGMEEELIDNTIDTKDSNGERIGLIELLGNYNEITDLGHKD